MPKPLEPEVVDNVVFGPGYFSGFYHNLGNPRQWVFTHRFKTSAEVVAYCEDPATPQVSLGGSILSLVLLDQGRPTGCRVRSSRGLEMRTTWVEVITHVEVEMDSNSDARRVGLSLNPEFDSDFEGVRVLDQVVMDAHEIPDEGIDI